MLKNLSLILFGSVFLMNTASAQSLDTGVGDEDAYNKCIEASNGGDQALTTCTLTEAERILKIVQKKYNSLASDPYFKDWNSDIAAIGVNFKSLYDNWLAYRNQYCSLYGFSLTQGEGSLGELSGAECVLEMTKRENKDMDAVIQNYKKM